MDVPISLLVIKAAYAGMGSACANDMLLLELLDEWIQVWEAGHISTSPKSLALAGLNAS